MSFYAWAMGGDFHAAADWLGVMDGATWHGGAAHGICAAWVFLAGLDGIEGNEGEPIAFAFGNLIER